MSEIRAASAGALRSDNEYVYAFQLANRVLERTNADPDDDLAVLARQFLRANERAIADHAALAAHDQKVREQAFEEAAKVSEAYGIVAMNVTYALLKPSALWWGRNDYTIR